MRFEFQLARELKMTHAELIRRLSGSEFAYWIAFFQMEAHDQEQAHKRAANRSKAQQQAARLRSA